VRPAESGEEGFVFRIEIIEQQGLLHGRLGFREPNGRETVRVVPGASCDEIMAALAVIAAVLVEPSAEVEAEPEPIAPAPPDNEKALRWGVGAGVGPVLQGAVAPEPRAGIGVEGNVTFETEGFFNPLLAVSYNQTTTATKEMPNGVALFEWWAVRTSFCPVRWPTRGWLALRPCPLFDVGRLQAKGDQTYRGAEVPVTWLAVGGSARLDVLPFRGFWLSLESGLFAPLTHEGFYFDQEGAPRIRAFKIPGVGAFGRLALGGRFE
jgi:hypothetical protein